MAGVGPGLAGVEAGLPGGPEIFEFDITHPLNGI